MNTAGRLCRYHSIVVGGLEARARYRVRVLAVNGTGFVGPPTTTSCLKPEFADNRPSRKGRYIYTTRAHGPPSFTAREHGAGRD